MGPELTLTPGCSDQRALKGGNWAVPREWVGERCFIICGGESVRLQRDRIPKLQGRIIAVKQAVKLRPDADVMFVSGRDDPQTCRDFFPLFRGTYLISRKCYHGFPKETKCLCRNRDASHLSELPTHLAGLDAGTSAINLAYLFGATEIILIGYDMTGGRWFNGEITHHLPFPPQSHFDRHLTAIRPFAADLKARGIKVYNTSAVSKVTDYPKVSLEKFL